MATVRFEERLEQGRLGENAIANWLNGLGYHVLPMYAVGLNTGKGPQLFTATHENLVVPDMLVFNAGKIVWVEAKHKSVFSWYRKGQQWVTGIDLRHYLDYLKVANLTPWPVWLMFLHRHSHTNEGPGVCPTGLYGHDILTLSQCESHRSALWGTGGMVYWGEHSLLKLAELDQRGTVVPTAESGRAATAPSGRCSRVTTGIQPVSSRSRS